MTTLRDERDAMSRPSWRSQGSRALTRFAVVAALAGCGEESTSSSAQKNSDAGAVPAATARLRSVDCSEVRLEDPDEAVECGWVTVPRDHDQPQGETLDLAVAVLKATGTQPASDPIVVLQGGPGSSGIERVFDRYRASLFALWREARDVVLLDQRGTGVNMPDLDCPEYDEQFIAAWSEPLSRDEEIAKLVEAMKTCHDRLVDAGVDLSVYTSAQSALDVRDVTRAIGYSEYNLFGVSYGGRLALTVMRDAPARLRSVVLDSPAPVPPKRFFARDVESAFKTLAAACDANAACGATYPELEQTVIDAARKLDREPMRVASTERDAPALVVTGPRALLTLFGSMYVRTATQWLPLAITQLSQGTPGVFASMLNGYVDEIARTRYAEAMAYSNLCSEAYPFEVMTHDRELASVAEPYRSLDQLDFQTMGACAFWKVRPPDSRENEEVRSDIPTLVLSGGLDPIVPHPYAEQIAMGLSSSQYVLFESTGHVVVRAMTGETSDTLCAHRMTQTFYDAPRDALDTTCLSDIPDIAWGGAR